MCHLPSMGQMAHQDTQARRPAEDLRAIVILERFESFPTSNYSMKEIIIGLSSSLIMFSSFSVGTLINNRLIARLAAT